MRHVTKGLISAVVTMAFLLVPLEVATVSASAELSQTDKKSILQQLNINLDDWELPENWLDYIDIQKLDLNGDGRADYIVANNLSDNCGSGGCGIEVYMSSQERLTSVAQYLGYSVELGVGSTNGVRDLIIDKKGLVYWNGSEYVFERKLLDPEIDPEFASDSIENWGNVSEIASRRFAYPTDILKINVVNQQVSGLLGIHKKAFYEIFDSGGPGSVKLNGNAAVSHVCWPHRCNQIAAFLIADAAAKKVYLAWKPYKQSIVVRPKVSAWPAKYKSVLSDWANDYSQYGIASTAPQTPDPTPPLCTLNESEAHKSDKCVRWYFACRLSEYRVGLDRYIQDSKSKTLSSFTAKDRDNVAVKWVFRDSQNNCEVFSYQEAEAALRAHSN